MIIKQNIKQKIKHSFDFYVLFFFFLAFIGWSWEVLLYLVTERDFVNRGLYQGPYLPIYGLGGVLLYVLLRRLTQRPALVFVLSALLCSALEYFGSWFLETVWGIRWWDYSGSFLNLNGRICLFGGLGFGFGGMLLLCVALPRFEAVYGRLTQRFRVVLSLLLLAVYTVDASYASMHPNTGKGITTLLDLF